MSSFWWLILGLLAGWLIELFIDYRYWRRQARIEAARLAEKEAALNARLQTLERRQAEQDARSDELTALQTTLTAKDAELLGLARRIDERAEEVTRLEQAMDKRRADLDRMALTLNEREKDIAGRDARLKSAESDYAARDGKLQAAEAEVSRRVAVVSNRESAMQNWEARILAREHELSDKEADLVREAASAAELRAQLNAMRSLVSRQYQTADGADDLEAIEGIGPKVSRLLHDADIRTFDRLSETSLGELTRILESGGPRLGLADPRSWAEQASCLVNGDYIAFERMRDDLSSESRHDAALLKTSETRKGFEAGTASESGAGVEVAGRVDDTQASSAGTHGEPQARLAATVNDDAGLFREDGVETVRLPEAEEGRYTEPDRLVTRPAALTGSADALPVALVVAGEVSEGDRSRPDEGSKKGIDADADGDPESGTSSKAAAASGAHQREPDRD